MTIKAVMPIKLSNERCPGKNTRLLGNKPLLQWELDNLLYIQMCDSISVYCSSEEIVPFLPEGVQFEKRPEYLDSKSTNFTQIFQEFSQKQFADIYVYAHATAPFITTETMKQCIEAVTSGKYDSAFCARKLQGFIWKSGSPLNFSANNLPRTQDIEPMFLETSGIYVFTREVFVKTQRRIGFNPFIKEVSIKEAIDIDYPEDFILAEKIQNVDI